MYCGVLFSLNTRSPSKRSIVGITCGNKFSASRNYEVLFVLAALFFKFCSVFFVMSQNVKRRLVVRSNDDRRHSTMIFSENVAVTEISKQIIEALSVCDRKRA